MRQRTLFQQAVDEGFDCGQTPVLIFNATGDCLGRERLAAVCRELTKKFEEVKKNTLEELAKEYAEKPPKGEIVVVVDRGRSEKITKSDLEGDLKAALDDHSIRDAVDIVAKAHALPRRKVYQLALEMTKG